MGALGILGVCATRCATWGVFFGRTPRWCQRGVGSMIISTKGPAAPVGVQATPVNFDHAYRHVEPLAAAAVPIDRAVASGFAHHFPFPHNFAAISSALRVS
jgi:hypothetical protein